MIVSGINQDLGKNLQSTLEFLKDGRRPREAVFQEIIDFVLPGLEDYLRQKPPGTRVDDRGYGSAGLRTLQRAVDGLFGYLVAPNLSWHREEMANSELQDVPEVRKWTQDLTEHFAYRFNETNFYGAIVTLFEHSLALGYGDIFVDKDKARNDIICYNPHPGELYLAENKYNEVDTIFRVTQMQRGQAVEKFGEEAIKLKLDDAWIRAANDNPFQYVPFLHAVYPRKNYNPNKLGPKNMKYASVWMELQKNKVVLESGYRSNPHFIWRPKKGNTPYGNGPAEDAKIEIAQDSEVWRTLVAAAQRSVEPPYNAHVDMEGQVDLTPHGINYYTNADHILRPVQTGINYPIGTDILDRVQSIIEKHFNIEFFLMLSQMEGVQPRNQLEIMERRGEQATVLARPVDRLQKEVLKPLFDRYFDIDMELGKIPPIPDILMETGGEKIKVTFLGPLAQAQKRSLEIQGINAGLEHSAAFVNIFGQNILDNVDSDGLYRDILKIDGFPQERLLDLPKVYEIREGRRQSAMEEMELQNEERQAKVVKDYAQADRAVDGKLSKEIENAQ